MLISFANQTLSRDEQTEIKGLELLHSIEPSAVTFFNKTPDIIEVKTYDESDRLQWASYQDTIIKPYQVALLRARGKNISVCIAGKMTTFQCCKGKAYLFDGVILREKNWTP